VYPSNDPIKREGKRKQQAKGDEMLQKAKSATNKQGIEETPHSIPEWAKIGIEKKELPEREIGVHDGLLVFAR
jgi:hypothetical protein